MCQPTSSRTNHQHGAPSGIAMRVTRLDRRVVLKAGALVSGLVATGFAGTARESRAQEAIGITQADTFEEGALSAQSVTGDAVSFQASFPFTAVGAHWAGTVAFPVRIDISTSADGANFTDWISVRASEDQGRVPTDNGYYADLVFTDLSNYVRYRTMDTEGNPAQIDGLKFTYLNSNAGPASFDDPSDGLSAATVSKPAVISRSQWGADERLRFDKNGEIWEKEYATVEHVIIHHTATPNFQDPFAAIRSIYYYHCVTQGWGDIGYNYLVDYKGNVYEGRVGGENVVAGHAYQYNYGSSGIAVMGDFAFQDITAATQSAVVGITAYAARKLNPYGVSDFKQVPDLPTICGHRDVIQTTCPGDYLYGDLQTIRDYVANIVGGQPSSGFEVGATVTVSVTGGILRSGPSIRTTALATMDFGTALTITGASATGNGLTWYPVTGRYGNGYVATTIITPTGSGSGPSGVAVGDTISVNTDALNMRSAPSTGASVVSVLPTDTQGTVIGGPQTANGYTWWQIRTSAGSGWVVQDYIRKVSTAPPPSNSGTFTVGANVTVNSDDLNFRASPGTNGRVIATLASGTPLKLIGGPTSIRPYVWWQAQSPSNGSGWVVQDFITVSSSPAPGGDTFATTRSSVSMHSNPSASAAVTATLPSGIQVQITDGPRQAENQTWYGAYRQGYGGGWVPATALIFSGGSGSTPTPPPSSGGYSVNQRVKVVDSAVNYRSGPGTSYAINNVVPVGTVLTVTGASTTASGYTWYPLNSSQYGRGYVADTYLAPA